MAYRGLKSFGLLTLGLALFFSGCGDSGDSAADANPAGSADVNPTGTADVGISDTLASPERISSDAFEKEFLSHSASTIVDDRDGRTYKVVTIGTDPDGTNSDWIAENMKVAMDGSLCSDPAGCEVYGRYYTVEAAQLACPAGWHLPSLAEYEKLLERVGMNPVEQSLYLVDRVDELGRVTNKFGFSALFAGSCNVILLAVDPEYCNASVGLNATFVTSDSYALVIGLDNVSFESVSTIEPTMTVAIKNFYSVRCKR